jgi:hypothetical protein
MLQKIKAIIAEKQELNNLPAGLNCLLSERDRDDKIECVLLEHLEML